MGKEIGWNFDNSYLGLPESFYTEQKPTPVTAPNLIIFNASLAGELGLKLEAIQNEEIVEVFAGNKLPEGSVPLAQAYAGHQFGHFTMLGDGRAVLLGEQIMPNGNRVDIQLKGSGRTPYSRGGDGRATLGPMLREYIISEAMHQLGIPTSRSLAVVETGEAVIREKDLPGAVLTRVAASHIRVGTFEYAAHFGSDEDVRKLAEYTMDRHYPDIEKGEGRYLTFLNQVIERQASLIAKWQLVGFIHGVMNTDNMLISGETIDYGPCAFMNTYSPATVFSSIDRQGRYAYGNQPYMANWNLSRFAETLLPLLANDEEEAIEIAQEALGNFAKLYKKNWFNGMRRKLGIFNEEEADITLIDELLGLMEKHKADFTNTFRALTFDKLDGMELFESEEFGGWHECWKSRLEKQEQSLSDSKDLMKKNNPGVIPRNHRVEEALNAAVDKGDLSVMEKLLHVLTNPYEHTDEQAEYCTPPEPSAVPYRTFCGT